MKTCLALKNRQFPRYAREESEGSDILESIRSKTQLIYSIFSLINEDTDKLFGADNAADLLMIRGAGLFGIDWSDQSVLDEYREKFVCDEHWKELVTHWHQRYRNHWMQKTVKMGGAKKVAKTCSMPESIEDAHKGSARPLVQGATSLNKEQAQAILSKYHLLLHPGLRKYFEKINLEVF